MPSGTTSAPRCARCGTVAIMRALRRAGALWRYWYVRGLLREGRSWLEDILAASTPAPDVPVAARARALYGAASLAEGQGDYARATTLADAKHSGPRRHTPEPTFQHARCREPWSRHPWSGASAAHSISPTVRSCAAICLAASPTSTSVGRAPNRRMPHATPGAGMGGSGCTCTLARSLRRETFVIHPVGRVEWRLGAPKRDGTGTLSRRA
jgi:hypothetical protein